MSKVYNQTRNLHCIWKTKIFQQHSEFCASRHKRWEPAGTKSSWRPAQQTSSIVCKQAALWVDRYWMAGGRFISVLLRTRWRCRFPRTAVFSVSMPADSAACPPGTAASTGLGVWIARSANNNCVFTTLWTCHLTSFKRLLKEIKIRLRRQLTQMHTLCLLSKSCFILKWKQKKLRRTAAQRNFVILFVTASLLFLAGQFCATTHGVQARGGSRRGRSPPHP